MSEVRTPSRYTVESKVPKEVGGLKVMADATSAPEPTCDVNGTCYCPLTGMIGVLSRKYAMQLVSIIGAHDSLRFGEIEEHLASASTSTISKRLGEFEEAGLVSRTHYDEIPPRVEYTLTDDGYEVRERLEPLLEWAERRS